MKPLTKKVVGVSALGALALVDLLQLQQAQAASVTFTGSLQPDGPFGSSVQVAITVDGSSGTYKITGITTPIRPTGQNASFANRAIPILTSEALVAQSASITGVSNASYVSAAWIQSLASAIASAAAAGERIGSPSSSTAPTPTTTPTPTPTVTSPAPTTTPKPIIKNTDPIAAILAKLVAAGTINQAQSDAIYSALKAGNISRHQFTNNENESEGSDDYAGGPGALKAITPSPSVTHLGGLKATKTARVKSGQRH